MSSNAEGGAGTGAVMGGGGGTSDNFGSFGFLPLGLGAGLEVAGETVTPLGTEELPPPPNLSLRVGTVGVATDAEAGVGAVDTFAVGVGI